MTRTLALSRSLPVHTFLPLLLAAGAARDAAAQTATPLRSVRVASGLTNPLWAGSPPGDEQRLFVVEQGGSIRILRGGNLLPTPFLSISSRIVAGGERGLLGLAFHPNFASNGYFYVNYTRAGDGHTMVVRFTVSASNPDVADPATAFTIIGPITQPYENHNGGGIAFGPDGFLYIGMGDGGAGNDPNCNAQRGDTLLGKMLRIDVDGGSPYRNPPTNPFVNDPNVLDEIWSLGWRNPWRFSFDRWTGDLYVGDVGEGALEEISFQRGTSAGGENYGWKIMEGTRCNSTASCPAGVPPCNDARLVKPIHEYPRGSGCSVIGGHVYRGCAIPDLRGTYFFGDWCSSRLWSFRYVNGQVTAFTDRTSEVGPFNGISSIGEDAFGELYVVTNRTGEVFKIVPAASVPPPATDLGHGKVGGNGRAPEFRACGLLNTGNEADFLLRHAPAAAAAALILSSTVNPQPLFGGTLAPWPIEAAVPFVTTASGTIDWRIPGGLGAVVVNAQYALLDPGASFGVGFSNALAIQMRL